MKDFLVFKMRSHSINWCPILGQKNRLANESRKLFVKIYLFNLFFYCCSSTVFCLFPPPLPNPPHLPPISIPPLIVYVSFVIVPEPFTLFPLNSLPSPLYSLCQPVLNFSVVGYILLACLFC